METSQNFQLSSWSSYSDKIWHAQGLTKFQINQEILSNFRSHILRKTELYNRAPKLVMLTNAGKLNNKLEQSWTAGRNASGESSGAQYSAWQKIIKLYYNSGSVCNYYWALTLPKKEVLNPENWINEFRMFIGRGATGTVHGPRQAKTIIIWGHVATSPAMSILR